MSPKDRWTDEAIASAKKYNAAGLSRSQIAVEIHKDTGLSFTRDAVIGKLARLGEVCRNAPNVHRGPEAIRPRRKPVNSLHIVHAAAVRPPAVPVADVSDAAAMQEHVRLIASQGPLNAQAPLNIPFLERTKFECGFICSPDGEPVAVCGHRTMLLQHRMPVERSSYCPIHHSFTHAGFGLDRRRERQRA